MEGAVPNYEYPWLGILFYSLYGGMGDTRSVTTVVLIHVEFVIANSADIGPMPKLSFRQKARVLLGEGWERGGRRVRNYVVHPEYSETINSIAIIHLRQPVRNRKIFQPICPPPERIRHPNFWVVKFDDNLQELQKRVLPVTEVSADLCREFYIERSLYEAKRRPSFVKCAVSLAERTPCVWGAGAALTTRDIWGRWQLLGLSVYGPGCGAPARFLDMLRYYPWIEESLEKFQRITISEINQHKYVLRSGIAVGSLMRFGECDNFEMQNLIYRDYVRLSSDNTMVKLAEYNMTVFETVLYTCLIIQLKYASASASLRISHYCPRNFNGPACYAYKGTRFDISMEVLFVEACALEVLAYGLRINISLIDIEEWKLEEGTYYEDLRLTGEEYRGPTYMTQYGFEPLDENMWVPDYDIWSTTPTEVNATTKSTSETSAATTTIETTTPEPTKAGYYYIPKKHFSRITPKWRRAGGGTNNVWNWDWFWRWIWNWG
ncbi:uncharacterized protein LOC125225191 [Leguminivora glycinivorella]|uniref:uncharacterized protein LOC125225191 n=1 Tax=Leguminivora glycinivorella TaxID=1035111 RepID=UPI0020102FB7|nr:uncharacterized protein LOC125225191 [Leguminivora glycinivorella]